MSQEHNVEEMAEQLHCWYLEALQEIDPNNYNHKAQKPYNELNEDQKFLDRYIAKKVIALHHSHTEEVEQARREAYAHCAIIREREINDILFEVADEARDSFGNGEKVIRKWMEKNNCEVHPLLIKD